MAIFGLCETNAMKAYRTTVGPIPRFRWLSDLADRLIHNPYVVSEVEGGDGGEAAGGTGAGGMGAGAGPSTSRVCGNQEYMEHHAKCRACGGSTHWMCACGYICCRSGKTFKATTSKGKRTP